MHADLQNLQADKGLKMNDTLNRLVKKIKDLEREISEEIQQKQKEFFYEIRAKKIVFAREIKKHHQHLAKNIAVYIFEAPLLHIITAPIIWAMIVPGLLMDIAAMVYQAICFPIYGIPKVRRSDYIVFDRQYLSYLNIIEKINCMYCAYFNGLIAYMQEVAARTEQYWCPIRHARKTRTMHSRYKKFLDYGDGESYREKLDTIRRSFEDVE